jgi:hypothetical protein
MKTSTLFDANHEEKCNLANFEWMYHKVYEKMALPGIKIKMHETHLWQYETAQNRIANSSVS